MKNKLDKEELEAIAEAPEEIKNNWSRTQQYIAQVVEDLCDKAKQESFDGDVDNGNDQR